MMSSSQTSLWHMFKKKKTLPHARFIAWQRHSHCIQLYSEKCYLTAFKTNSNKREPALAMKGSPHHHPKDHDRSCIRLLWRKTKQKHQVHGKISGTCLISGVCLKTGTCLVSGTCPVSGTCSISATCLISSICLLEAISQAWMPHPPTHTYPHNCPPVIPYSC